jgi:ABC transporter substrate binding protein
MMRRRVFLGLLSAAVASWPVALSAQQTKIVRIGALYLGNADAESFKANLREGLRELGCVEGQNIAFEFRSAEGKADQLPLLAGELVRLKVDVIVALYVPCALAAKQATTDIPIVAIAADPVETGIVPSLARPGGNIGYAWDRWMVFVGGGYAQGSIHGEYRVTSTGAPIFPAFWGSSRNDGWYVGGGVEAIVHRGPFADVVLGVEYQHFELENKRAFTETPVGGFDDSFDVKARGDIVRARLSVKTQGFGWVR